MLDNEKPDFIDIATPPIAHLEMIDEASRRGIHVLCQKPVAESIEQLDEMIALSETRGIRFMVNENCRFQPWFRRIRSLVDEGTIGKPFYVGFFSRHRGTMPELNFGGQNLLFSGMERLVLLELGVHYIDTLRYLLGEPDTIYAMTSRVSDLVRGDDTAQVIASVGDARAVIDLSWASMPTDGISGVSWGDYRLEGTGGSVRVTRDGVLTVVTDAARWEERFPEDSEAIGYRNALEHFAKGLRTGASFETSGEETRKTMTYLFAAYESSRSNVVWKGAF